MFQNTLVILQKAWVYFYNSFISMLFYSPNAFCEDCSLLRNLGAVRDILNKLQSAGCFGIMEVLWKWIKAECFNQKDLDLSELFEIILRGFFFFLPWEISKVCKAQPGKLLHCCLSWANISHDFTKFWRTKQLADGNNYPYISTSAIRAFEETHLL